MEILIDGRTATITELAADGNRMRMKVDDEVYEIDAVRVGEGVYSVIFNGKSYNLEIADSPSPRHYVINSFYKSYQAEIIDAPARYRMNRSGKGETAGSNTIVSPMPGKVVKVLVKPGQQVEEGETLVIISAMKMESNFKAKASGVAVTVNVQDGDTVDANQVLIVIE